MLSLRRKEHKPFSSKRFLALSVALLLCLSLGIECYAAIDDFTDSYAANDIRFYNPDDCRTTDGSASTLATGDSGRAMIWNYFIAKGFSDIAAAGLVGNAMAESGASPTRASNSEFWGIFQWGYGRRVALQDKVRAAGLGQYLDSSYWPAEAVENIPKDDYRKLIQIELDHAMSENDGDWQNEIKNATSAEEAAEIFLVLFERAVGGEEPIQYYAPYRGELYQGTVQRHNFAAEALQEFSGAGPSAGSSGSLKVIDGSNLVWIGDSLSVNLEGSGGGKNYFKDNLPQALYNVHVSKQFHFDTDAGGESGLSILKSYKDSNQLREVLVFALGTNDTGSVTAENIKKVVDLAGSTSIIVFVTNYATNNDYSNNNRAMKAAALEYENVVVADWANAVSGKTATHLAEDGVHLTEEGKELFFTTIMSAINGVTDGVIPEECCDTAPVKSSERVFKGSTYTLTDGQIRGIVAMVSKENAASVSQVKTQVAQMANRFEKFGREYGSGATGLIDYIRKSKWYAESTASAYNEDYKASEGYFKAVEDVLVSGNRPIPQEVVEYAAPDEQTISAKNNESAIDVSDRSQYESGHTRITKKSSGASWIFFAWADEGAKSGDAFGYLESDPPSGNNTAAETTGACCEKSGEITYATINGYKYAFPLAGATKANYLNPGGEVPSYLSRIPCSSLEPGACHHDYHAVDMGVRVKMIKGGNDPIASDFVDCSVDRANCYGNEFYYSVGATVVAPIAGTISKAPRYYGGATSGYEDECGSVTLRGEDGNAYWLGHLSASSISVEEGDTVAAGDKLAEVGVPQCAQGTQAHLHIDNYAVSGQASPSSWSIELMNKLWEHLPDSNSGAGVEKCEGADGLKVGGLSFEEAEALMQEYLSLANKVSREGSSSIDVKGRTFSGFTGCSGGLLFNCVAYSRYFLFNYVNAPEAVYTTNLGDGAQIVGSLAELGFKTGTEPRPYAIFSWDDGGAGHTGVVLGVIDNDTFITGEASCSYGSAGTGAFKRSLSDGHNWTFAYTDGMISGL